MYNLFDRCIVIEFTASVWTANKRDRVASAELNAEKGSGKAARVNKSLLPGVEALEKVQAHVAATRQWLYKETKPWSDLGQRLCLMDRFQEVSDYMDKAEATYWVLVAEFLEQYPLLINAQAFQLGSLFNRSEYPPVEKLRGRFAFRTVFVPVAQNDWVQQLESATRDALTKRLELETQRRMEVLEQDNREAVLKALKQVVDRLGYDEHTGKPNVFRKSLLDNLASTLSSVRQFNLSHDQALASLIDEAEQLTAWVDVDELRNNTKIRDEVRTRLQEVTDAADVWGF